MTLESYYNDILLTELAKEELAEGRIPTIQELVEELDAIKADYPTTGEKPLFSTRKNQVASHENASIDKANSTFHRLSQDTNVLYDIITNLRGRILKQSARWSTFANATRKAADELEDRIDALLLMSEETLGYFKYVSDDFLTLEFTNLESTTALVDPGSSLVTIAHSLIEGEGHSRVDISDISSGNISTSFVDGPDVVSLQTLSGHDKINIISDEDSTWLANLKTKGEGSPASIAVEIRLTDDNTTLSFNKVVLKCAGSTATSAYTISLFYSQDGIDWLLVPTNNASQSTLDVANWIFETIDAEYIRIVMTKNAHDDVDANSYNSWDFGIASLKLYKDSYDTEVGYTFVSTQRTVDDETFSKAALSVCEIIEDKTDISYYLSIDEGNSFHAVDPLERENPVHTQVVDFSDIQTYYNTDSSYLYDSDRTAIQLDKDNDAGLVLSQGELPVNFYIPVSLQDNLQESDIVVYRNIGDKTLDDTVRGYAKGWHYDSDADTYSCWFRVSDPDGAQVDLGTTKAYIDGVEQTGSIVISEGVHSFETNSTNWFEVTSELDSLADLENADSLYPYNHRYLIEGYNYSDSYEDEEVYHGMTWFAEYSCSYLPQQDFKSTDTVNLSVYTRMFTTDGKLGFVVKTDRGYSDYANETIMVSYKLAEQTFSSIVLKAVLSTTDSGVAPAMDSYLIKLG